MLATYEKEMISICEFFIFCSSIAAITVLCGIFLSVDAIYQEPVPWISYQDFIDKGAANTKTTKQWVPSGIVEIIFSNVRFTFLSFFFFYVLYLRIFNISNTTGDARVERTTYTSLAPMFTPSFSEGCVAQSLVLCGTCIIFVFLDVPGGSMS